MKRLLLTLALLLPLALSGQEPKKIRVACIGDSITYGMKLENRETESYPAQLQQLLGEGYEVGNFGKNGATLLRKGHRPYMEQAEFAAAMQFPAQFIVIHLGVNDTDPRDWPGWRDHFVRDYLALIDTLKTASPRAKVLVALTSPIGSGHPRFQSGTQQWQDEIQEAIRVVADVSGAGLIDFHTPLYAFPQHIPDQVHPDAWGAGVLARVVYGAITGDHGGLQLPVLYTDRMVMQRGVPLDIHGVADTGETVTVRLGSESRKAVADLNGRWSVTFPAREAATGLQLRVSTPKKSIVLEDVAIGEVWLCSGQSNMEFRMEAALNTKASIDAAEDPGLRLFDMKARWRTDNVAWPVEALEDLDQLNFYREAAWTFAAPQTVQSFSAVAYYFGKRLREELGVPVGLICNAVGGSTTESWIDRHTLETGFPKILENWTQNDFVQDWARERALKNLGNRSSSSFDRHPYQPCYLFEAGMLPLERYSLAGVIWYQGESNAHNKDAHAKLFTLLTDSWRAWFNKPELPFYYVQLSSLNRPSWTWFRDSQRELLGEREHLGMAVTSDLGDPQDVHFKDKKPVGERLARWALHDTYGRQELVPSGPLFREAIASGSAVWVFFDWGEGLHAGELPTGEATDGPIIGFEIAEKEGLFYPATATVVGDCILLAAPEVPHPTLVRYGWQPYTRANLYNAAGLPASTFRGIVALPAL